MPASQLGGGGVSPRIRVRYQAATGLMNLPRRAEGIRRGQAQRADAAARGDAGIEGHQILQARPHPAQHDGKPRGLARIGQMQRQTDIAEETGEAQRPHPAQQRHRRQIERELQGFPGRELAMEAMIEILRRIIAEAHGPIGDDGLGMDQQIVEGQAIDEGLQRRAGRADGADHVVLAAAADVEVIRRPHIGAHRHGGILHHQDRQRRAGLEPEAPARGQRLQPALQIAVDEARDLAFAGRGGHQPLGQMRRIEGGRQPPGGDRRARGFGRGGRAREFPPPGGEPAPAILPPMPQPGSRSGRKRSGDCGSATSSAASPSLSSPGSLPK